MRIINLSLDKENTVKIPLVACIGYFDGMHLGHQALIKETIDLANHYQCASALITFDKDPLEVINDTNEVNHITQFRQRVNRAVSFGIQNIVILHFTKEMATMPPKEFITKILAQLDLKALVCGFDFHYGDKGAGDYESLKRDCEYPVIVVDAVCDEEGKISSTRIRSEIENGNINS